MNYQFVLLDVDGTLLNFRACEAQAFRRGFEVSGYPYSEEVYRLYHELNAALWERHERGELDRERLLTLRFDLLFDQAGIVGDSAAFEKLYREFLADGAFLEQGALDLLERLRKSSCGVYIVTNGICSTQEKRLEASGINAYVDGVFISEKIGWQKPTVQFFDCCFSQIPGFCRERAVIVGDSLSADIQGGINAGIATCWYNPEGKVSTSVKPDMEAATLDEVWRLLDGQTEAPGERRRL